MNKQLEKPFEYLRRKDRSQFASETIKNWYMARAFVLNSLEDIAFKPNEDAHLHFVVKGDDPLMLSVVRQLALSAHFINYDEEKRKNRTVITIVSQTPKNVEEELQKEEYLCNLLKWCKYICNGTLKNKDSFIDVEINIVNRWDEKEEKIVKVIERINVVSFCNSKFEDEIYSIDTRKAVFAGRMYDLGTLIENLPAENIHDAHRYFLALDIYQFQKLQEPLDKLINESKWMNQIKVKNGLSNVFCADCFETRIREIKKTKEAAIEHCKTEESKEKIRKENFWEKYNELLSKSEHARWVVEKLIMGFRPLNNEERIEDERLSPYKEKRKCYRDELKTNEQKLSHIDLCSYVDLRRVNPDDMKFDSFLMLAIPKILEKIRKDDDSDT